MHRLPAMMGQVDDREAAMGQGHPPPRVDPGTAVVGPSMHLGAIGPLHCLDGPAVHSPDGSRDSAHDRRILSDVEATG